MGEGEGEVEEVAEHGAAVEDDQLAVAHIHGACWCSSRLHPLCPPHSLSHEQELEMNTGHRNFLGPAHERRHGCTHALIFFFLYSMSTWCSLARYCESTGGERAYKAVARTHDHHSAPTTRTHAHTHPLVHAQLAAARADDALQRNHRGRPATGLGPPAISLTN
jgi:hypothetical protein